MYVDAALGVPLRRSEVERVLLDLTGNELPQPRATVVGVRLCTEDVHLSGRIGPDDALSRRHAGDAVAHDNVPSH